MTLNEEILPTSNKFQNVINGIIKCQTDDVTKLCILDAKKKFIHGGRFDIGGTYRGEGAEFWFYFGTAACLSEIYLVNLFVINRTNQNFNIGVSESYHIEETKLDEYNTGQSLLTSKLSYRNYIATKSDEEHYITTYTIKDLIFAPDNQNLFIPIRIKVNPSSLIDPEIVRTIKLNNNFASTVIKQEKADFIIETRSGKEYPVHKIIIASHSPTFRNIIKTSTSKFLVDIDDNDMELLVKFMYNRAIDSVQNQDMIKLLDLADKFQMESMTRALQLHYEQHITIDNAIKLSVISEKYKLYDLQKKVFNFIKKNQTVLETDGFKNLDDVIVTKKLLHFLHVKP